MSKYYMKETHIQRNGPEAFISLFLLDFDNDSYEWLVTMNEQYRGSDKFFDNLFDTLISHMEYTHRHESQYSFDMITKHEAEELIFLLGI